MIVHKKWKHIRTGRNYTVLVEVKMKNPQTSLWEDAYLYMSDMPGEGTIYVREKMDFLKKFSADSDGVQLSPPGTIEKIKALRSEFKISLKWAKEALEEANNDLEAARAIVRDDHKAEDYPANEGG